MNNTLSLPGLCHSYFKTTIKLLQRNQSMSLRGPKSFHIVGYIKHEWGVIKVTVGNDFHISLTLTLLKYEGKQFCKGLNASKTSKKHNTCLLSQINACRAKIDRVGKRSKILCMPKYNTKYVGLLNAYQG